ncbi:GspH/FimT family pseudopilin [Burkholderia sp. lig30]|uniref:GspH/FimT family pseudopilin n=1 Tax=Burkholderia sp. lig30 TaxID=1192124 RepID=UPI0009F9E75E
MRTSVRGSRRVMRAGIPERQRRVPPAHSVRGAAGFTLLEMLVVLVIAGLLVAVVALAPSRNRRTDLAEDAQRLANLLESAGDEAQVRSLAIAWQPVDGGYRFLQHTERGNWTPMTDELFRPRRWGADVTGVSIRYTGGGEPVSRVVIGEESIDVPVTITLSSGAIRLAVVATGIGNFVVQRPLVCMPSQHSGETRCRA